MYRVTPFPLEKLVAFCYIGREVEVALPLQKECNQPTGNPMRTVTILLLTLVLIAGATTVTFQPDADVGYVC